MAINVSFNGATIYRPGAYSRLNIDLGGSFPLGATGLVAIFGESTRGKPGADESTISRNVFLPNQIAEIRQKYGSGPIVDAMNFLFAPASDGAIPNGAQAVYIYKTNSSTRATLSLANSFGEVRSLEYGVGGNTATLSAIETQEEAPIVTSSAAFDETAIASGSFDLLVNGVKTVVTVAAAPAGAGSAAAFVAAIDAQMPAGVTASQATGSVDGAAKLQIEVDADALANRKGWGKSLALKDGTGAPLAAMSLAEGLEVSAVEASMIVTVKQTRDLIQEQDAVGGNVVLQVGYDGASAAASVEVSSTQVILTAASVITLDKSAYPTMIQLVNAININAGWKASLTSTLYNSLSPSVLDQVDVGAKSSDAASMKPARIKKDAAEVAQMFAESTIVDIASQSAVGLMDALNETALAGGSLGSTTSADVVEALAAFEEIRVNAVIPLFSRDAIVGSDTVSGDVADNLTDVASSYTILGIHQAVKTHCQLMSTTKNRSERQAYLSYKNSFSASRDRAALLADPRIQLAIQDTRNIDSQGNIKWFQPWAQACMIAGARAGSPIGTPLTFKFFNLSGIRHTAQSMSTAEEDILVDFNPNSKYQEAIQNGITFFEQPQSGGIRCLLDNTTYQKDGNWVYNRGNVMYAADVLCFDFRNQMENIYVGKKNNVSSVEVKSTAASILDTYLAQGITVSTAAAPGGYKDLTVKISGNTINISLTAVLVEGIDFILNDITITRVQS
jgi:hypothetical protein